MNNGFLKKHIVGFIPTLYILFMSDSLITLAKNFKQKMLKIFGCFCASYTKDRENKKFFKKNFQKKIGQTNQKQKLPKQ